MALILAFTAALLCALNNLFMRRSIDSGGSSKAFLVVVEAISIVVAILIGPIKSGNFAWNNTLSTIGLLSGLFLGVMMWALGRAMEKGPAGITVAWLNASTVAPAVIMAVLFGATFGHGYEWWNGVGSALVLCGLFWAVGKSADQYENKALWIIFASTAFLSHVIFLVVLQWRALMLNPAIPTSFLLPFTADTMQSEWFMPMIFVSATIFLLYSFIKDERRLPKGQEVVYGIYGGVCNAGSTYLLIKVAQIATPLENAMAFPLFAVSIIVLCNIWGKILYQEKVHWKAMSLCVIGVLVGTMNWKMLF